ncbi:MAG: cryptochrome/photolyase family protein [Planctomycetaceae bacterium]|nr:cryptochrome/photolyase family protein [Planctomycetaceae bacterium]
MSVAALIYPHQLFDPHPAISGADAVFLIEDPLLFSQFSFHKQKLILHRATMKRYLAEHFPHATYIEAHQLRQSGDIVEIVQAAKCQSIRVVDPCDDWLSRRLQAACASRGVALNMLPDPHFLTPIDQIEAMTAGKQHLHFTDFYIAQRKRMGILLTPQGKPRDGKWSFDAENRKKLPVSVQPPVPKFPRENSYVQEARRYVARHFPKAIGNDQPFGYPTSATEAKAWLSDFLQHRFSDFGIYEDAISTRHRIIFHSVLTPMLNIGLLSPREIVEEAMRYDGRVPMNSLEGFIRQVIGWREFIRLVYLTHGRQQRTRNFWEHARALPAAFYSGTTGIAPVDHSIRSVLETGYCHHIERLMVLGNFMLLCDIRPHDVYRWFMELFIDAYDWVMVPNVYGMSQHADGGLMTTKPYISGSSYILKMSDYKKAAWCPIWDALYWRFVDRHTDFFAANPRMSVMVKMKEKLGSKMAEHHRVADKFLADLG